MGVMRQEDTNTGAGTSRASRIVPRPLKVLSFGYRYPRTAPVGADVVMDARCLCEDPAEKTDLRTLTGLDPACKDFLSKLPDVQRFINAAIGAAGDPSVNVLAVACHSGRHRSVYIAERLGAYFGCPVEHLDMLRTPDADIAPNYI